MSKVATINQGSVANVPAAELINTLRNSLYPGAAEESVMLVLSYCKAAGLDPMQKPVHIVPMWSAAQSRLVDQVMPGIGLYRIQAARTGHYAGVSEPEFGPDVTEDLGGQQMTYPAWCKVIVKRSLASGQVCEFAAVERWKENYATKTSKVTTPNAMWARRPYAQLAKCAEAQALRKAFPEVGSQPTADEMEGKEIIEARDVTPEKAQAEPQGLPPFAADKFTTNLPTYQAAIDAGRKTAAEVIAALGTKYTLSAEQIIQIESLEAIEGEQP
jgi:phage recombination protein Bet